MLNELQKALVFFRFTYFWVVTQPNERITTSHSPGLSRFYRRSY